LNSSWHPMPRPQIGQHLLEGGGILSLTDPRRAKWKLPRRIETGKQEVLRLVLGLPYCHQGGHQPRNALHAGSVKIREITNETGDEETSLEEEQIHTKRFFL